MPTHNSVTVIYSTDYVTRLTGRPAATREAAGIAPYRTRPIGRHLRAAVPTVSVPMLAVVMRVVVPLRGVVVRDMWTRMRDVRGVQ